jgi:hypothetical protein
MQSQLKFAANEGDDPMILPLGGIVTLLVGPLIRRG